MQLWGFVRSGRGRAVLLLIVLVHILHLIVEPAKTAAAAIEGLRDGRATDA